MKLYCLSGNPNRPCFVLKFKQTTILLDCGLDVSSLLHFLPLTQTQSSRLSSLPGWSPGNTPRGTKLDDELKECAGRLFVDSEPEFCLPELGMIDLSEVDVILISNYHCMLALPYITEYTNFKGTVYATDPTLQFGRLFMEEIVSYISDCPKPGRASKWKQPHILGFLPPPLRDAMNPKAWKYCYNQHDINSSLANVKTVGFKEKLNLFGALTLSASSSGFCIGSCNWTISSEYEKIGYVSGSSTWTTHPEPMDQASLKDCDILIMCGLTQTPSANPDTMMGEFCINTAMTLRNGGNVLATCHPAGVTFDLFECLSRHLESCGLTQVPMYFICPVAASSLAYANIYAEWLSTSKQSKVYLPEAPFPHAELVKSNWLKHYPNIHGEFSQSMKTPCVVFAGHPSLRIGNVVHFLELWGKNNANTLIITEPDFPHLEALGPYQPLAMKVCYCPIDTSLSFNQANKLVHDLRPLHLVIPEQYTSPPVLQPQLTDFVISCEPSPVTYKRGQVINLPVKRRFEKIDLDPKLAASLLPVEVRPGLAVASITGELQCRDNHHVLKTMEQGNQGEGVQSKKRRLQAGLPYPGSNVWGSPIINEFTNQLKKQGLVDVKVEESLEGHIVELPNDDTLIQIEENSTHIYCSGNEELRVKIRDALLKCLEKF